MSTPPPDRFRALREEALASIDGSSLADQYERGAIEIVWSKLFPPPAHATSDVLRVGVRGELRVPAHVVATVADGLQDATARMTRARLFPEVDPGRKIGKEDRRRAQLIQEAQVGNVIFFRFQGQQADGLDVPQVATQAHEAVRTLVDYLPSDEADDSAVDAILGGAPALRLAVKDLSVAARVAGAGLDVTLESEGTHINSVLTKARAGALVEELGKKVERVYPARIDGTLDGLRGSRHVVYLISAGRDIAVSAADEQLWAVRPHIGKQVALDVTVTERMTAAGGKRVSYGLVAVHPHQGLF